jgi:hypothetical protein
MSTFKDHAVEILKGEPTINDSQRSDLWDLFHQSANATELARRLHTMPLRPDLKEQLLRAKNKPSVKPDPIEKVLDAMQRMDPKVLDLAEKHPHMLKLVVDLATREEE